MISLNYVLFAATVVLGSLTASKAEERDPTYAACDSEWTSSTNGTKGGPIEVSDFPVFYVAPGLGACGIVYTDDEYIACVNPGWVHSAYQDHCGRKVAVADPTTGKHVVATVLDVCGAVPDSKFGCNDIALSKIAFEKLGGNTTANTLEGNVIWRFLDDDADDLAAASGGKESEQKRDLTAEDKKAKHKKEDHKTEPHKKHGHKKEGHKKDHHPKKGDRKVVEGKKDSHKKVDSKKHGHKKEEHKKEHHHEKGGVQAREPKKHDHKKEDSKKHSHKKEEHKKHGHKKAEHKKEDHKKAAPVKTKRDF